MNIRKTIISTSIAVLYLLSCYILGNAEGVEKKYEIMVKYQNSSSSYKNMSTSQLGGIEKLGIKKITAESQESYEELMEQLQKDPSVLYTEPVIKFKAQSIPNDPYMAGDWGLNNINAPKAWDITTGNSQVVIAVVDSGVEINHPDLKNNLVAGYDFVHNDNIPEDEEGHGTLTAQIIGAVGNNGFGKAGVSYSSKIMALKVLDKYGDGYSDDIAKAIIYGADRGAKIINLSLGSLESSKVVQEAAAYAYNKGTLLVGAAGNNNGKILYPAAYREVMAVGAINKDEKRADYSSYGEALSMTAPGTNIVGYDQNQNPITDSGTSFSAPFVSGAAALIWSYNQNLTNDQVQWILESAARDLGSTGWDPYYGYGTLDLYKALTENILYFDNEAYQKPIEIFLKKLTSSDADTRNSMIFVLKPYFLTEDRIIYNSDGTVRRKYGIYRLQDALGDILSQAGIDLNNWIGLGFGDTPQEVLENLRTSLNIFLDWTLEERGILLDLVAEGDNEGIQNLLIQKKVYNPYKDNNNDLASAVKLLNLHPITEKLWTTRDADYYTFNVNTPMTINIRIQGGLNTVMALYQSDTNKLIYKGSNAITVNITETGDYYVKVEEKNGMWSDQEYILSLEKYREGLFGDVNQDNRIDLYDLAIISRNMGINIKDPKYNPLYDGNLDDVINILDLNLAVENYGYSNLNQ